MGPEHSAIAIRHTHRAGVDILRLTGDLDLVTGERLAAEVHAVVRPGAPVIVVLSDLRFMDASGLRALLDVRAGIRRDGRRFAVVCRPESPAFRLLRLTRTLGRLHVYRAGAAAVAGLAGDGV